MLRCLFVFSMLSLLWAETTAQTPRRLSSNAVRADLTFLQEALYRGHPGVFRFNPRDSLDVFFDRLRRQLPPDSVSYEQTQVLVRLAVARVRDGHTSVETAFYNEATRVLPVTTQVIDNKVFILRDYAGDTLRWRGAEIRAVNGIPARAVVEASRLMASTDGYNETFRDVTASVFFARNLRLLFGTPDTSRVELAWSDGRTETRRVLTRPRSEILALQQTRVARPPRHVPVFKYKDTALYRDTLFPRLAVLKLGSFPDGRYKRFYRKTFRWLNKNDMEGLVVDLRFNTGGSLGNLEALLTRVLDERAVYQFERRRHVRLAPYFNRRASLVKALVWLRFDILPFYRHRRDGDLKIRAHTMKPHRRHNFDGKVFVLTNGWSFSSASMAASFLKNRAGAATIGAETGGGETGNCGGGYPKLVLPNTRIKVRFPLHYLRYDVGRPNHGRGVLPDFPTRYTIDHYLNGRDLDMEKVYELIRLGN